MTIKEKRELLTKPVWTYKDVKAYTGFKKTKAFEIIKFCKENLNGEVVFREKEAVVRRDSVLEYCGSSIERERYVLKQLEEEEKKT